jgi:hypothetical protein
MNEHKSLYLAVVLLKFERGAITTSLKSVVIHERKQIPQGRDETEWPVKAGRFNHSEKMEIKLIAFTYLYVT